MSGRVGRCRGSCTTRCWANSAATCRPLMCVRSVRACGGRRASAVAVWQGNRRAAAGLGEVREPDPVAHRRSAGRRRATRDKTFQKPPFAGADPQSGGGPLWLPANATWDGRAPQRLRQPSGGHPAGPPPFRLPGEVGGGGPGLPGCERCQPRNPSHRSGDRRSAQVAGPPRAELGLATIHYSRSDPRLPPPQGECMYSAQFVGPLTVLWAVGFAFCPSVASEEVGRIVAPRRSVVVPGLSRRIRRPKRLACSSDWD